MMGKNAHERLAISTGIVAAVVGRGVLSTKSDDISNASLSVLLRLYSQPIDRFAEGSRCCLRVEARCRGCWDATGVVRRIRRFRIAEAEADRRCCCHTLVLVLRTLPSWLCLASAS